MYPRISIKAGILLLTSVFTFNPSIQAAPYVGFGVGSASYDVDLTSLGGGTFEDSSTATKLYAGYTVNKYFAIEASYHRLSETSIQVQTTPGNINARVAASMNGLSAYGVAMYPASKQTNLMLKLGAINWDADLEFNGSTATDDGTDMAYAIAASYAFTRSLLGTVEWESFQIDNPEVSVLSVGFRYNFK